jgi:hypothetical protein
MGKTKSKQKQNEKNIIRSDLTGRVINGRDVILTEEAEDYLKMMGYKIIKPAMVSLTVTMTNIFLLLGGFILFT